MDSRKYGSSKDKDIEIPSKQSEEEELFTPFSELCKFAEEYQLELEIEKPFVEFDNLFLKVIDVETEEVVKKVMLNDISSLDDESASLLNELSKKSYKA